jgi:hypothetical protein
LLDKSLISANLEQERIEMKISKLEKVAEGKYKVHSASCSECGNVAVIEVDSKWVYDMHQGGRVSDLMPFPQYSMELREKFITGLCGACWNKVMMGIETLDKSSVS